MRLLDRLGVQFQPAGVGQFDKTARGGLEALQIGRCQLETFGFPFSRDGQPIDATAFDDQPGPKLPWREEKPVEGRIAQILGLLRLVWPSQGKRIKEFFVRIPYPDAGFGRKPIQPPQPLHGRFQARVLQDFRLLLLLQPSRFQQPFLAGPMPHTLVAFAAGQQSQAHRFATQLKDKLWQRLMRHAKLLPLQAMGRLGLA